VFLINLGIYTNLTDIFSSWQNTLAQLINPIVPNSRDPVFEFRSLEFRLNINFVLFATCAQLGAWAAAGKFY
jgi:hypothetical protein